MHRYDSTIENVRRTYSLDSQRLCFLTVFAAPDGIIEKYSFDIESARDSHYHIESNEMERLRSLLRAEAGVEGLVKAISEFLDGTEISVARFVGMLGEKSIKYRSFHFD